MRNILPLVWWDYLGIVPHELLPLCESNSMFSVIPIWIGFVVFVDLGSNRERPILSGWNRLRCHDTGCSGRNDGHCDWWTVLVCRCQSVLTKLFRLLLLLGFCSDLTYELSKKSILFIIIEKCKYLSKQLSLFPIKSYPESERNFDSLPLLNGQ